MVDDSYPARRDYQTGNFTRGAWLIEPPADAAYASAWFIVIEGSENPRTTWNLFSIQDKFTLSLKRDDGRHKLTFSYVCGGDEFTYVELRYTPGWHFVSVALYGEIALVRFDNRTWHMRAPFDPECTETSVALGPRLDAPWDTKQAENSVIRFYDFKVSTDPQTQEDLAITRNHLNELGTDTPIVCNPRNGNERREGLKACYPGPVVRVQYLYDAYEPNEVAASAEEVTADIPIQIEESAHSITEGETPDFGQRECLIILALGLILAFLVVSLSAWYSQRSFDRQVNILRKQAQDLIRLAEESENTGSSAQASASGGLNV